MHAASLLVYTALCAAIDVEPRHPRKRAKVKEAAGLYVTASNSAFGTRGSEASLVPGYICMYLQPRISCKRFWSDLRRTDLATRPIAADRCVALSVWKLSVLRCKFHVLGFNEPNDMLKLYLLLHWSEDPRGDTTGNNLNKDLLQVEFRFFFDSYLAE